MSQPYICIDDADNIYFGAEEYATKKNVFVAKVNKNTLQTEWITSRQTVWGYDSGQDVTLCHTSVGPDGNPVILLYSGYRLPGTTNNRYTISKLNGNTGDILWTIQPDDLRLLSNFSWVNLKVGPEGNIYVGHSQWTGSTGADLHLALISGNGEFLWKKSAKTGGFNPYGASTNYGIFTHIDADTSGNVYQTAMYSNGNDFLNRYFGFIKYSISGAGDPANQLTSVISGLTPETRGVFKSSVRQTLSGIVTGASLRLGSKLNDLFTISSSAITENTVLRVPALVGNSQYRIDALTRTKLTNGEVLYIPEDSGSSVQLTLADESTHSILLSGESVVYNDISYGIGDQIVFASDFRCNVVSFGSVGLQVLSTQDICFPAGTPIKTDQGEVAIETIQPFRYSIRGYPVVAITKTYSSEKRIVRIPRGAIGKNLPTRDIRVSLNHKVGIPLKDGVYFVKARHLVNVCSGVTFEEYLNKPLYNVLLPVYGIMNVNGMPVETLHPQNPVAKGYILAYYVNSGKLTVQQARALLRN